MPPEWMDGVAFLKLVTFPIVVGISVSCFLLLPLFYAAAGAIEVFLYIEQNTREKRDKLIRESLSGAKLDRLGGGQRAVGSEGC